MSNGGRRRFKRPHGDGLRKGRKERATPILLECICTREELIGSHETTKRPQLCWPQWPLLKRNFFLSLHELQSFLLSPRAVEWSENPRVTVLIWFHNLPLLVEIRLTDLPKSGCAMAPPGTTGLSPFACCTAFGLR
jgi:hypothetical protein